MSRLLRVAGLGSLLILHAIPFAHADKRVALVIGNSAYKHVTELPNPKNDAADIAASLRQLGFQVIDGFDLDKAAFDRKVRDFAAAITGADIGLFYYAGHGLQVGGSNYLVPVDAELATAAGLDWEMVRLDLVQRTMEREAATNVLFLDACRDNPLARNLARAMGTRSTDIGRGLAATEGGVGTLISFSTQPGNVALDGSGRNSPFAAALAKHILNSNDDLSRILIAVRNDVIEASKSKQVPWEHSALRGPIYLNITVNVTPSAEAATPSSTSAPAAARAVSSDAAQAWALVKETTSQGTLTTFIGRYGDTFYGELAKTRLAELQRPANCSFYRVGSTHADPALHPSAPATIVLQRGDIACVTRKQQIDGNDWGFADHKLQEPTGRAPIQSWVALSSLQALTPAEVTSIRPYKLGYELLFDGKTVNGLDAVFYTLDQAKDNCKRAKQPKRPIRVECRYDGGKLGYELIYNGKAVNGPETEFWSLEQARANCAEAKRLQPNLQVQCRYDGNAIGAN